MASIMQAFTAFEYWNQEKTTAFSEKKILFQYDNAPVHASVNAMIKINELVFKLLSHAPYSPELAPSNYVFFSNLKKWLGGQRAANNEEVESAVNGCFKELDGSYYKHSIEAIEYRWEKCIELKGDYVKK